MHIRLALLAFIFGLSYWSVPPTDPDLGWHLLGGRWIAEHGSVPERDFINSFNSYWHDYHWLGQVVMQLLYTWGGYSALATGLGLLTGYLCKVIMDIVVGALGRSQRESIHELAALLYFLAAAMLLDPLVSIRPQMISLLSMALAVRRLEQAPTRYELLLLLALTILLVNVHVYWVFIPFLWGIYRCLPGFRRRGRLSSCHAWGGLLLLGSAGLLSPYGLFVERPTLPQVLMNYALVYEYLDIPSVLRHTVGEFRSTFAAGGIDSWVLMGVLVAFASRFSWKRALVRSGSSAAAFTGVVLACRFRKYAGVCGILALPALVRTRIFERMLGRLPLKGNERIGKAVTMSGAGITFLYAAAHLPLFGYDLSSVAQKYPIEACRKLTTLGLGPSHGRDHVRVLTHFDYGGWCRFAMYEAAPTLDIRVTTDNRTQGVPEEHYLDSFQLHNVKGSWLQTLDAWRPDAVVVALSFPLAQFLAFDKRRWELVHEDQGFALFRRR